MYQYNIISCPPYNNKGELIGEEEGQLTWWDDARSKYSDDVANFTNSKEVELGYPWRGSSEEKARRLLEKAYIEKESFKGRKEKISTTLRTCMVNM